MNEQPPIPTPPHVFDAMQVIAEHLRRVGYVSVLVGSTGGAIFYRNCPLKDKQELLEQLVVYETESKRGPTCREFAYALGHDQAKTMGIPLSDEPLDVWKRRRDAERGGGK